MSIYTKTNPYHARLRQKVLLNPNSSKETYHLVLDIKEAHLPFQVGDSVGILPQNDQDVVDAIVHKIKGTAETKNFLLHKANICKCTSNVLKLLESNPKISCLLEDKTKMFDYLQTHHLIDILDHCNHLPSEHELCERLLPLMPRFYSIASSPKMFPEEIHLTIASLTYPTALGPRRGVGSHFPCHYATDTTPIPLYVQPSNGFTLPTDPKASIILIGPGTGIAPFRAFLQERMFLNHEGRSWLFFGGRNKASDFYYKDYWLSLEKQGRLRLDLAFSRDSAEKTYVQHVLYEKRSEIWDWLQKGAYLYVCGDASQMAKDVDATLQRIGSEEGGLIEEDSRLWLKALRKERRYLQDVY